VFADEVPRGQVDELRLNGMSAHGWHVVLLPEGMEASK
jgi:hypothetical protein